MINPLLAVAIKYMKHSMQAQDEVEVLHTEDIAMYKDIAYMEDKNPNHLMDLYCPIDKDKRYPLVIDIHGGAWIYGDKQVNQPFALEYAKAGFAVVNMNYTLMPMSDIRIQIQEIIAMLRYVKAHAQEYPIDISNVILSGDSAGGHLSALCYAVMNSSSLCELYQVTRPDLTIRALISLHGVHDLSFLSESKRYLFRQASDMLHGRRTRKSDLYHKACLLDVAKQVPAIPMLLVSSEQDMLHVQSLKTKKVLQKLHWPIEVIFVPKDPRLDHVFEVTHPQYPESKAVMKGVFQFIENSIKVE